MLFITHYLTQEDWSKLQQFLRDYDLESVITGLADVLQSGTDDFGTPYYYVEDEDWNSIFAEYGDLLNFIEFSGFTPILSSQGHGNN